MKTEQRSVQFSIPLKVFLNLSSGSSMILRRNLDSPFHFFGPETILSPPILLPNDFEKFISLIVDGQHGTTS